jgi:hypothetical protein
MFRASTALSNQAPFYGFSIMRSNNNGGNNNDGIKDTMIPDPATNNNKAMLVLWTRNSNQGNGDDNWLAYKLLDEDDGSDVIVDDDGHVDDWSTLLVRIVEAASLKLTVNDAATINLGDTITGAAGEIVGLVVNAANYVIAVCFAADADELAGCITISGLRQIVGLIHVVGGYLAEEGGGCQRKKRRCQDGEDHHDHDQSDQDCSSPF